MTRAWRTLAFLAVTAAAAVPPVEALAGPYADVSQIVSAFSAISSVHMVEDGPHGQRVTVDYVRPDRWRFKPAPGITEIMIGNDLYLHESGRWIHLPNAFPGKTIANALQHALPGVDVRKAYVVKSKGTQLVDGTLMHVYGFTKRDQPGVTGTMWVRPDHLPAKVVVDPRKPDTFVTIRYSRYDAPISITPPAT